MSAAAVLWLAWVIIFAVSCGVAVTATVASVREREQGRPATAVRRRSLGLFVAVLSLGIPMGLIAGWLVGFIASALTPWAFLIVLILWLVIGGRYAAASRAASMSYLQ